MRQINYIFAVLTFLFFSTHASANSKSCDFLPETPMPEWVMNPLPSDDNNLYGYGVASAPNDNLSQLRKNSSNDARNNLSESLQVRVKSQLTRELLRRDNGKTATLNKEIKSYVESQSDAVLIASEVVAVWLQPESCHLWTKVRIDKASAKTSEQLITNSALQSIEQSIKEMSKKLDNVKKETSTDPRKELANRGLRLNGESFAEALYRGESENVQLFLQAGMKLKDAVDPQGESFRVMFYRTDIDRLSRSLDVLTRYSVDKLDLQYYLVRAVYRGHLEKLKLFVKHDASINKQNSGLFDSYVWRNVRFKKASILCLTDARISYFNTYPEEGEEIKDYVAIRKYLHTAGATSKGSIITYAGINERRYHESYNCETQQRSQVKY